MNGWRRLGEDRCEIFNRKTMRIIKFLILFFLISCNNHKNEVSNLVLKNEKGEDEIAILQNFLKQNGTTYYNLTNKDVELIEKIMEEEVESIMLNKDITENEKPEKLENYIRQYLAYTNREGEKEVFVFCVSKERKYPKWRTEFIRTIGGGNTVFKGVINLSKEKSLGFSVNDPM